MIIEQVNQDLSPVFLSVAIVVEKVERWQTLVSLFLSCHIKLL